MLSKTLQENISKILAVNNECPENVNVHVMQLEPFIFETMAKALKNYVGVTAYLADADENGMCPYAIIRADNDEDGREVYAFVSEHAVDKCIAAVRAVINGHDPD